jgi:hypothetical protein
MLSIESAEGVRFMIMDAKYRTSRENVLDAMASAHIYQDSLRIGGRRPDISLLFLPRGGGAPWLEEKAFQSTHHVGVHVLSPGLSVDLPDAMRVLLDAR